MHDAEQNLKKAKRFILIAWLVLIPFDFLFKSELLGIPYTSEPPFWVFIVYILSSILMLYGVLLGSRGAGKSLTFGRLFSLLFAFPNWVILAIYVIITRI